MECSFVFFFFFFSSRRRHTRSTRDWSSDVCSSDLQAVYVYAQTVYEGQRVVVDAWMILWFAVAAGICAAGTVIPLRSEERRVGKSVDLGGRRIIKKKKTRYERYTHNVERRKKSRRQ